jgi:hypothetical protein
LRSGLRAVQVVLIGTAQKAKLFIAPKMRIPEGSVIHRLFHDEFGTDVEGEENLSLWEHSGGKRLADQQVWIEAKKVRDRVVAIVQPL